MDSGLMLRNQFTIKLAGINIQINTISPRTCILCRNYFSEEDPDIKVHINHEDVEREYRNTENADQKEVFLETVAVYRKILDDLLPFNVFLMHGAVIAHKNEAFMFTAPSGTGKTTHIRQWLQKTNDTIVVNGDKPLIKIDNNTVYACGTPWSGNEHLNTNTIVPLKAIVFLERCEDNHIREISFIEAYTHLLQQTHIPHDPAKARETLKLLSQLSGKIRFYLFQCNNFKEDCFETAYNALVNN